MAPPPLPQNVIVPRPASGASTGGFVRGMLRVVLCLWICLPALIFGQIRFSDIRNSGNMLARRRLARRRLVVGSLVLGYLSPLQAVVYGAVMAIGLSVVIPLTISGLSHRPVMTYRDRYAAAKPVVAALRAYAKSHQNQLPPDLESLVQGHFIERSALTLLERERPAWASPPEDASRPSGWNYTGAGMRLPDADRLIVLESRFTNEDTRHLMMGMGRQELVGKRVR